MNRVYYFHPETLEVTSTDKTSLENEGGEFEFLAITEDGKFEGFDYERYDLNLVQKAVVLLNFLKHYRDLTPTECIVDDGVSNGTVSDFVSALLQISFSNASVNGNMMPSNIKEAMDYAEVKFGTISVSDVSKNELTLSGNGMNFRTTIENANGFCKPLLYLFFTTECQFQEDGDFIHLCNFCLYLLSIGYPAQLNKEQKAIISNLGVQDYVCKIKINSDSFTFLRHSFA